MFYVPCAQVASKPVFDWSSCTLFEIDLERFNEITTPPEDEVFSLASLDSFGEPVSCDEYGEENRGIELKKSVQNKKK